MNQINYDKRWKIVRTIGHGAFGTVYEIVREDFGETYRAALKVISIPQSEDELKSNLASGMNEQSMATYYESCVEELRHEFSILSKMKGHTNIVGYEDHQVVPHSDGVGWDIYIRMELLTSLTTFLSKKNLSRNQVVKLGIDLCQALSICEKRNVIHRDIKPDNIFISDEGDFKLGDFGIARTASKTLSNMSRKGTPNYMAPEIFKNEPYNHTVDIYSLGIVLYQLMNGKRLPFMPETMTLQDRDNALGQRMSGAKLPAPENCDFPFASIILRACAYRPEDRYQSADDMMRDLQMLLNGQKVEPLDMSDFIREEKPEENVQEPHRDNFGPVNFGQYDSNHSEAGQQRDVHVRPASNWNPGRQQQNEIKDNSEYGHHTIYENGNSQPGRPPYSGTPNGQNGGGRKLKKNNLVILITAIIAAAAVAVCAIIVSTNSVSRKKDSDATKTESKASSSVAMQTGTEKKTTSSTSSTSTTSEEEATAVPAGTATQLSDSLGDYTFELKGHIYQLPMAYTDFIKNGFELDDSSVSEDATMDGMSYVSTRMADGATRISVDIYNPSGSDKALKECYIGGIDVSDASTAGVKVAKGISLSNTPDEVIEAFGQPYSDDTNEAGIYRRITYQDTDDYKKGRTQFAFPLSDDATPEISIQHMVAIEGTDEEVSTDRPAYLDTYKAPETMDTSETSTDITIEGKIYRIPCPVNEFTDDGWEISSKEMDSIPSGRSESGALLVTKGEKSLYLGVKNFESTEQLTENCAVDYVDISNYSSEDKRVSFETGVGITEKTSKEDAIKMLPDFDKTESNDHVSLNYYGDDNTDNLSLHYYYNSDAENPAWSVEISNDQWPDS